MSNPLSDILRSMDGPPPLSRAEIDRQNHIRAQRADHEKMVGEFREKVRGELVSFIEDTSRSHHTYPPMANVERLSLHEEALSLGLISHSFGVEIGRASCRERV
eukprot:TRINITY_DN3676_c1_g1_i2.p2 TRINITY_DN3676_c1_g1~~TRINITY_DN3676_c1_g1_i2.p2  ORF type:complete len:104 (-),score=20.87 TRINITY_DN3676_c1_g1_i2:126-437(-)